MPAGFFGNSSSRAPTRLRNLDFGDFLSDAAAQAPGVGFMECDGRNTAENVGWYYVAHWYPTYVLGVAAGLMSKTGKLGYIASFPWHRSSPGRTLT